MNNALHSDDDWRIAVHEAGHAVAAAVNELGADWVAVGPDEYGEVELEPDVGFDYDETHVKIWLLFYAAGAAAETLLFGSYRKHAIRRDKELHDKFAAQQKYSQRLEESILLASECLKQFDFEQVAIKLHASRRPTESNQLNEDQVTKICGYKPSWER